jgi:hypothetical protein
MSVGQKLELWQTEYSGKAYTDQMDKPHEGYIVTRRVTVTIAEVKDVPCIWSGKIVEAGGRRAVDDEGNEYFQNWNGFPSDSMTPHYYWWDNKSEWCDAAQASRFWIPHVTRDGQKAKPQPA